MNKVLLASLIFASASVAGLSQSPRTHELHLSPQTVHWGYYDGNVAPVLRVASGDTIRVETMVAAGLRALRALGVSEDELPQSVKAVESGVKDRGPGPHPLTGPIWVEGAEPGDVLEVKILSIEFLHPYGWVGFRAGGGTIPEEFPHLRYKLLRFKPESGFVTFAPGLTLKLAPFFGSIGVAPDPLAGRISSSPPGYHTGNLDNKELVSGSTLYLPVHARGALLSLGDGHALQGDGEVTGTALETSLLGKVQVFVRKGKTLKWPRAETPTHYISMGLNADLDQAAQIATREMVEFLAAEKGISPDEAYLLCSLAVDLRVTQVVDGTKGVHAMISKSIFGR